MVTLDDNDYRAIAARLLEAVGDSEFYNGKVEYDTGEYCSTLTATLIVYREPLLDPADPTRTATRITGIVPVWWEFHLYVGGVESANEFSWSEFKSFF